MPASRLKPRRTARILGGRNRAEISLSFFEFFSGGARKRKIVRENFCEVAAEALAEAGNGAEAYDLVQSHHALRAYINSWCRVGGIVRLRLRYWSTTNGAINFVDQLQPKRPLVVFTNGAFFFF